ncbi:MAG TPA: GNVR domain-containing protein, partial [Bacteroidales bacterium]|nr:GNVR domain-containing protein [Bacteroidales bacterium]
DYLKKYITERNDVDDILVPSSMGVDDPLLAQLLAGLSKLYEERSGLLLTSTAKNPAIAQVDSKIRNAKLNLIESINSIVSTSNIALKDIDSRIAKMGGKIQELPSSQRKLLSFERQFNLNNDLFTYLLQKRAEAQITKASNLPDNEIIDEATGEGKTPVYPKKSLNYLIALLIGAILPAVYIYLKDYLNDKIMDRNDIEKATRFPIIGQIMHSSKETAMVVVDSPKSSIAESFRNVRTSLQFIAKGEEKQTILVTSDIVGAGKTFISLNMASVFALYGKRTLLIGFDLRKPKLFQEFNLSNTVGVSSYLIKKSSLNEILHKTHVENLDVLLAGPVPPNPAELIASER